MSPLLLLLLLLLNLFFIAASSARYNGNNNVLRILPDGEGEGEGEGEGDGDGDDMLYCDSWRFSVETNNAGPWSTIPRRCAHYVASYMTGPRYLSDSGAVANHSLAFAVGLALAGPRDAWVFDVDETLLSNLPYYQAHGFGLEEFNETAWDEWVAEARAPALPESLRLYEKLRRMGFRMVLLTGRPEEQRGITERNLLLAGYTSWETLILRNATDLGKTAVAYKSEKRTLLVAEGYRICGNSGDQWSDLLGTATAIRSFKLPNPMYHIE